MRQTVEEFHEPARKSAIKIVHSCGWDCAPADLGVLFLAQHTETALHRSGSRILRMICRLLIERLPCLEDSESRVKMD